jgi:UPF0271 protein
MEIDLNADLGEGFGCYRMGNDEALMSVISSANVACGYHAGDPVIMERMSRMALAGGIDLGAHVGFRDLMGFGRREMQVEPSELASQVLYQLGALAGIAAAVGHRVTHLNFHGALGAVAAADQALSETLLRAVAAFDRDLIISVSTHTRTELAAKASGMRIATMFLADRAYDDEGRLVPRKVPGSVILDSRAVLERVDRLLDTGQVETITGKRLKLEADSILLHGDTPGAVESARAIRKLIETNGGRVVPISRLLAR